MKVKQSFCLHIVIKTTTITFSLTLIKPLRIKMQKTQQKCNFLIILFVFYNRIRYFCTP